MVQFAIEKEVVLGRPFLMVMGAFSIALIADLVLNQDVGLASVFQSKEMIMLSIGVVGLIVGYMVNIDKMRRGNYITTGDVSEVTTWGGGLFIVMTMVNTAMAKFSEYQSSVVDMNFVLVVAAAPMEELFFRFFLTSIVFHSALPIFIGTARVVGLGEDTAKVMSAFIASLIVSITFMAFHAAVADIFDPKVMMFFFVNSFAYCMVYLMTGNIMVTTTAHMLHNIAVVMLI